MNIYGYSMNEDDIRHLSEVTLHVTEKEINDVILFLNYAAKLMAKHGDQFGHEHFSDFNKNNKLGNCGIVIFKT